MKVLDALAKKSNGESLVKRLTDIRRIAQDKLDYVRVLFPQFTNHTIRHGDGVVEILDRLMADDLKEKLNEWELYFLVAAAYLHDIGMVEACPGTPEGAEWDAFYKDYEERREELGLEDDTKLLNRAKRDYIRDHHHERSAKYIEKNWRELELRQTDTPGEGRMVGRISLGHRKVDLGDTKQFGPVPFGNNQLIRRDLLAAYLRLADELDMTAHRTPWAEYEVLIDLEPISETEWAKHLSISGFSTDQGIIVIAAKCHKHHVFLRLRRLHAELKTKLAETLRDRGRLHTR